MDTFGPHDQDRSVPVAGSHLNIQTHDDTVNAPNPAPFDVHHFAACSCAVFHEQCNFLSVSGW